MSNIIYFGKSSFFVIVLSLFLSACGGGNDTGNELSDINTTGVTDSGTPVNNDTSITLSGSVGDGPVTGATVVIKNSSGEILKSVLSNEYAKYSVNIRVNANDYPLMLEASGGIDLVTSAAPDFILYSVVTDPSVKTANLNPFTTMIIKTAAFMLGGLSAENIEIAKNHTLSLLNFGLDTRLVPDPITSDITSSNIAVIVKSSETFGEMIRRTRDTLNNGKSADDVILDLAEDLTDGALDGSGANGTIPRTSTISHLISAQVLLEALSNDLRVGGINATVRMDNSIAETMPGITTPISTDNVLITSEILSQTIAAIDNAISIDNNSTLTPVAHQIAHINADTASSDIAPFESSRLDSVIEIASSNGSQGTLPSLPSPPSAPATPVNNKPVISGTPPTSIIEGSSYRFAPDYSDMDGDQLTFNISNKPRWASFNIQTGVLAGTPGMQDAGNYSSISISVNDGTDYTYLPSFSIAVNNLNRAPSITGSPAATITANGRYSFTPSATDADGDSLTFSIINKPNWATFDPNTGALTGTPSVADIGSIARNININVNDGQVSRSLTSFDIEVLGSSNGSATLSWTPPTENTDNSALTDLAGYRIYYGSSSGVYPNSIDISNPAISSYIIGNLSSNTYYFVITAYTANGVSSGYSNEVSKVVN